MAKMSYDFTDGCLINVNSKINNLLVRRITSGHSIVYSALILNVSEAAKFCETYEEGTIYVLKNFFDF